MSMNREELWQYLLTKGLVVEVSMGNYELSMNFQTTQDVLIGNAVNSDCTNTNPKTSSTMAEASIEEIIVDPLEDFRYLCSNAVKRSPTIKMQTLKAFWDLANVPSRAHKPGSQGTYVIKAITGEASKVFDQFVTKPGVDLDVLVEATKKYYGEISMPAGFSKFVINQIMNTEYSDLLHLKSNPQPIPIVVVNQSKSMG